MAFYNIDPKLAKKLGAGALLDIPKNDPDLVTKPTGDPDEPHAMWRETFEVQGIRCQSYDDGTDAISVRLKIPADVTSENQGRTITHAFRFPFGKLNDGVDWAQAAIEINYKSLQGFCRAVGYDGPLEGSLDQTVPWDDFVKARVNALYERKPDKDGITRQDVKYFRTPD